MFYLGFICLVIIQVLLINSNRPINKYWYFVSSLPLVLIVIFRFGMGPDYFSYQYLYENLPINSFISIFNYENHIDIGYKVIMYCFRQFNVSFHTFFVVLNLIILFLFSKWIFENSKNSIISITLFYTMFYFVWVLSSVRQGLVIAVVLNLFFSERVSLNNKQKLIAIVLLSLVHKSALFVLVLLVAERIKWTKKIHLYFFGISLFSTLIPISWIINKLSFLSPIKWVVDRYMTSNLGFFDVSSLMRFFFFALILVYYNRITSISKYYMKIVDATLFGFSFYFLLKFSELTASRATVYTFLLVIIIIPVILNEIHLSLYSLYKIPKYVIMLGLVIGQAGYLQKELLSMQTNTYLVDQSLFVPFISISDQDYSKFSSLHAFLLRQDRIAEKSKNSYINDFSEKQDVIYSKEDSYMAVKMIQDGKSMYGIINQNGNWIRRPYSSSAIYVYDDVVVSQKYNGFFAFSIFEDLGEKNRSELDLKQIVEDYISFENLITQDFEEPINISSLDLVSPFDEYFSDHDKITNVYMSKINDPFEYFIIRVEYSGINYYFYLNSDKKPLSTILSTRVSRFSKDGFLKIYSYAGNHYINIDGEVVWWE